MSRSRGSVREKAIDLDRLLSALEHGYKSGDDVSFAIVSHTGTGTAGYAMAVACAFLRATGQGPVRRQSHAALVIGSPETRQVFDGGARDTASLIRVLKYGVVAKDIVEHALDACGPACQSLDENSRAFLILATSFVIGRRVAANEKRPDSKVGDGAFTAFFHDRAELAFLLSHIKR